MKYCFAMLNCCCREQLNYLLRKQLNVASQRYIYKVLTLITNYGRVCTPVIFGLFGKSVYLIIRVLFCYFSFKKSSGVRGSAP